MGEASHYHTLNVDPSATQAEIKQAYRQLAKRFHPDTQTTHANHDAIARINAAYEVLGDPQQRRSYDQRLNHPHRTTRQQRTADAQQQYRHYRQQVQTGQEADAELERWLKQVYTPVNRLIQQILQPLRSEIDALAADPFDDELMEDFQAYLADSRADLKQAQQRFRSMPNPPTVAGVAANLYYCLNQVGDGIEELERFTCNYDETYLHTGQELFRIAKGLQREAQAAVRHFV